MQRAVVKYLNHGEEPPELKYVSMLLEDLENRLAIDKVNWKQFPYKPEVNVIPAWDHDKIYLKFSVNEKTTRARSGRLNYPVHLDSCVEFFVAPGDGTYFNLEINAAGTVYLGHGTCRSDSRPVEEAAIIETLPSLGKEVFEEKKVGKWDLTVAVPLELFRGTPMYSPGGKEFRANFYKCGDELEIPHYLTWNRAESPEPDFHRPESFGTIWFETQDE